MFEVSNVAIIGNRTDEYGIWIEISQKTVQNSSFNHLKSIIARSLKTYPELEHIDSEPPSTSQFLDKDLDRC